MIDTSKIIHAPVGGGRYTVTAPIVKEDYGLYLKIEGLELPSTYEVDFSNDEHSGSSVTMIGNSDGVLIPSQFISSGKDVFAFLYHVGADFGRTVYKFRIPNKLRPDRTDEQPTPEEQSVIDQTISALNDAVESAQEAQEAIENMSVSAQTLAEGESATVTKTESEGVVHLEFGIPKGATGPQGIQGETGPQGPKGDAGDDYVLTEQDKQDIAEMVDVPDSGMVVTATQISGAQYSIDSTYDDIKSALSQGKTVVVMTNGVPQPYVGNVQLDNEWFLAFGVSTIYNNIAALEGFMISQTYQNVAIWTQQNTTIPELNDVQIGGNSIVTDGVANVPIAAQDVYGTVKFGRVDSLDWYGLITESNGSIAISGASDSDIKDNWGAYKPIVPQNQHKSVFYGLAKAAGDTTQSASSNAVGNYTDDAKIAIQKMLGIYEAPWELIREDTFTNAEEANHIIDTDANGETFELTDVILLFETPKQATVSSKGQYGDISFFANGVSLTQAECGVWTQNANDPAHGVTIMIEQEGNMLITTAASQATNSNNGTIRWRYGATFDSTVQSVRYLQARVAITSINIFKVLGTGHYKLYGKRKWQ